jgi:hypothetical protein
MSEMHSTLILSQEKLSEEAEKASNPIHREDYVYTEESNYKRHVKPLSAGKPTKH